MLEALRARLGNDPETELAEAAEQQRQITRIRLEKLVRPVAPLAAGRMMRGVGAITTHVLDTSAGRPAAGVAVELEVLAGGRLGAGRGGPDRRGRARWATCCPRASTPMAATYRIRFDFGRLLRRAGRRDLLPGRHGGVHRARPEEHHHVPLLLSPFGYSTYRGS